HLDVAPYRRLRYVQFRGERLEPAHAAPAEQVPKPRLSFRDQHNCGTGASPVFREARARRPCHIRHARPLERSARMRWRAYATFCSPVIFLKSSDPSEVVGNATLARWVVAAGFFFSA